MKSETSDAKGSRLKALDVMRGLTVVCMIVVNNAGGNLSYRQLQHSDWNGLTVCDLVFPFFLFIMGVSTFLSLSKGAADRNGGFGWSMPVVWKIVRRTALILLICWGLHWFGNLCHGRGWLDFEHLRLTGVLTRIAICYGVVSLMALLLDRRAMIAVAVLLVACYGALLLGWHGYDNSPENVNSVVDRWLLADGHLYTKRPVDPEGLLATLSAIAHTIVGFCFGGLLKSRRPLADKVAEMFVWGSLLALAGLLISGVFPINKRIWSPSYLLVTCGLAAMALGLLTWVIDGRGMRRWCGFFEWFGVNPLFLYVVAEAIGECAGPSGVKGSVYGWLSAIIPDPYMASAAYSVLLVALLGAMAYPLYRKRIFIKI